MFLHHVNYIEHNINIYIYVLYIYIYWHGGSPSYTPMIVYAKTVTLKNDAPSEIANFQRKGTYF